MADDLRAIQLSGARFRPDETGHAQEYREGALNVSAHGLLGGCTVAPQDRFDDQGVVGIALRQFVANGAPRDRRIEVKLSGMKDRIGRLQYDIAYKPCFTLDSR